MLRLFTVCLLLIFLQSACNLSSQPEVSFYYWKTTFKLSAEEQEVLTANKVAKLYIRYFDIILSPNTKKPVPESPINFIQKPDNFKVVSVVYITNTVFLNKATNLTALAKQTVDYITQINRKHGIKSEEIQIDCDWTLSSRDRYLRFVKLVKAGTGKVVSATIRLHQIKYAKQTKVPDVDYGVLMFYNMGKIAADAKNSIYDRTISRKYLKQLKDYPLSLKIALPVFSWGIQIRNKRVIEVINHVDLGSFENDSNFVCKKTIIHVKTANLKFGKYFKAGDRIKIEQVSEQNLSAMIEDLSNKMKSKPQELIFFDLDSQAINRYDKDIYKKMANSF